MPESSNRGRMMTVATHFNSSTYASPYIGVFHSTNGDALSNALSDRALSARADRDGIVFTFYGKPSYTLKKGGSVINEVTLCFNSTSLDAAIGAFSFDTGGLHSGKYSDFFAEHMKSNTVEQILAYFKIEPIVDTIGRYVTAYFGNNVNYVAAQCAEWPSFAYDDSLLLSWRDLISWSRSTPGFDPPATTIEIQMKGPIEISKNSTKCLIIPFSYLDRSDVVEFLRESDTIFLTYEDELLADASSLWTAISDLSQSIQFDDVRRV